MLRTWRRYKAIMFPHLHEEEQVSLPLMRAYFTPAEVAPMVQRILKTAGWRGGGVWACLLAATAWGRRVHHCLLIVHPPVHHCIINTAGHATLPRRRVPGDLLIVHLYTTAAAAAAARRPARCLDARRWSS